MPDFTTIQVPSRIADLGFSFKLPSDFRSIDLPEEQPDFSKPEYFIPLHVAMASYGAIVFSVAARPAYDDGSVEDWARYHAARQEGTVRSITPGNVGSLNAIVCDAEQPSEAGTMRLRAFFIEDGKRLLIVSGMAPEAIWPSVGATLLAMIDSFTLATPKGQTAPLRRSDAPTATAPTEESAVPAKKPSKKPAKAESIDVGTPTAPADVALADDASSLDQDHPMNARFRDNGVGLVPRVLEVKPKDKYAVLGAGAIVATFRIPLGWHAMDDGKRTLVFDAAGKIQVNLSLRHAPKDRGQLIEEIKAQNLSEQPALQTLTLEVAGMPALALRNYRVENELLEQAFLLKEVGRKDMVLVCRVTAPPDDITRALNLAEVILTHLKPAA